MLDWVSFAAGAGILAFSIVYFARDCRGNVSASMGGEMTFSTLWNLGWTLFFIGLLPIIGLSRFWAFAAVPVMLAISFPMRSGIQRRFCVPYKPEPTGFQKFVRKTTQEEPGTNK
jgi:hypothetical protein